LLARLDTKVRQAITEIIVSHREFRGMGGVAAAPGPPLDRGPPGLIAGSWPGPADGLDTRGDRRRTGRPDAGRER
jgi:hypothetical protein